MKVSDVEQSPGGKLFVVYLSAELERLFKPLERRSEIRSRFMNSPDAVQRNRHLSLVTQLPAYRQMSLVVMERLREIALQAMNNRHTLDGVGGADLVIELLRECQSNVVALQRGGVVSPVFEAQSLQQQCANQLV